jgi:hypothetical protein
MSRGTLKLRELLDRLKPYGIVALQEKGGSKRGKGSEIILLKPNSPGSQQGPTYPIKNHGKGTEITTPVIDAVLRRFNISKTDFWRLPEKSDKKSTS